MPTAENRRALLRTAPGLALLAVATVALCQPAPAPNRGGQQRQERPAPAGVSVYQDVPFLTVDGRVLRMTITRPTTLPAKPLPVIVYIHGGAWRSGTHSPGQNYAFADKGYLTASIEYRLSQEAQFPAQIHDCKAAIRWLRKYAAQLHLDPERIGVWGTSAGGHLAAMLGTSAGVEALEGPGNLGFSSAVTCVATLSGPSDLAAMVGQPSSIDRTKPDCPEAQLIGGMIAENPEKARAASPVAYVDGNEPPFLIMNGTKDMTVPFNQGPILNEALEKAGAEVTFVPVEGGGHGLEGETATPTRQEQNKLLREFFAKHLRKTE